MKNELAEFAARYLDLYASAYGLPRPMTAEQVKDAGVLLLDLMSDCEGEAHGES